MLESVVFRVHFPALTVSMFDCLQSRMSLEMYLFSHGTPGKQVMCSISKKLEMHSLHTRMRCALDAFQLLNATWKYLQYA